MAPGSRPEELIQVPATTLDDILMEGGAPQPLDFLSVDVEGHEIEVLRGFDFARSVAAHPAGGSRRQSPQTLVPQVLGVSSGAPNQFEWLYVPADLPVHFGWEDRWQVLRKYYLALPFRVLRNVSRRLRQPIKDRRRARHNVRNAPLALGRSEKGGPSGRGQNLPRQIARGAASFARKWLTASRSWARRL